MDAKEKTLRKKKKRRRKRLLLFLCVAFVLLVSGVLGVLYKYKPTSERYDARTYFGLTSDDEAALIVNDEILEKTAIVRDGTVYISYSVVTEAVNDRFYWDASIQKMLYTTTEGVVSYGEGEGVLIENDTVYLTLALVQAHTPMDCSVYDSPSRVVMRTQSDTATVADITGTQAVRYRGGIKSPILTEVTDTSVTILYADESWSKVVTEDGYIGYIQNKYLGNMREEAYDIASRDDGYVSLTGTEVISLAWHQVTNTSQNADLEARLTLTKGLNVISPTWFYLTGTSGEIVSYADASYVSYAHEQGLQVWALVDNFSEDVDTYTILSSYDARQTLIDNLIAAAAAYGIDGINVDFEELTEETGPAFLQFIRELSLKCHDSGLVLSVDNHAPYDYNAFYGRAEQAVFADYIILMGYDEHLNLSTGEGSVASIDFVTDAIVRMLEEGVPSSKLINALPFYTRIWKEVPKTEEELEAETSQNTGNDYVSYNLEWDTLGIASAKLTLEERGVALTWDDDVKQYYGEYTLEDGTVCKVWMEEEASIEEKLKVMSSYDLIGVAAWKLGLETESIWEVISSYYNGQ